MVRWGCTDCAWVRPSASTARMVGWSSGGVMAGTGEQAMKETRDCTESLLGRGPVEHGGNVD